jgi:hypothetical protein
MQKSRQPPVNQHCLNMDAHKFADYVIEKWLAKVRDFGIGSTNDLARSFVNEVRTNANGDVDLIKFTFLYYGCMVDMGVGRGITLADAGLRGKRKPKPWFTPVLYAEIKRLGELLCKDVAMKFNDSVLDALDSNNIKS